MSCQPAPDGTDGRSPAITFVNATEGGQEQHRRLDTGGAHGLDDGQPIDLRKHPIDDHEIVALAGGKEQSVASGGCEIHRVPVLLEPVGDIGRGFGVVFDDQDFHIGFLVIVNLLL